MRSKNKKSVCVVAGGSGGHTLPALTLANRWKDKRKIFFFTTTRSIDKRVLRDRSDLKFTYFKLNKFPGKKIYQYPAFCFQFLLIFIKTFFLLLVLRPSKIISTGGDISIPVCFAGRLLRIPIDLYEVNAVPGRAIKLLSKFAKNIFITFDDCKKFFPSEALKVNYPLRFVEEDRFYDKKKVLRDLGLDPAKKTIFLLGGSQGSVFLNRIFKRWVEKNKDYINDLQIIHQTGSLEQQHFEDFYKKLNFLNKVFDYSDNVKKFYQAADLIVCRAGAGTLFEINFFQKRCLVIPHKNNYSDHQSNNVISLVKESPKIFCYLDQDQVLKDKRYFEYFLGTVLS
ncbi:UDP-N-acetylglucosamine--N-acetylmuramyl-(pentapeptide) pyrophosphoryl-undecaprenol N-acetylglucosamine transferase [Candidatus Babeliales bacterium]|nr:UDP-N-acetylglucosamine--N-acetylmuramyl-(pentapeptide) pyrophosphoryl-undecaprenol N-acetylglucosamine transferase [Candidatus Babeliales bacterium]